jgi:multidrug transporter EmrE-like cation transporter
VFLKSGAIRLHLRWDAVLFNWRLAAGVVAFLLSSVFFVAGVKQGELSVLYPMVSLGYVWTLLWSRIFFGEPFTRSKFIGLAMILSGILFLGLGSTR